MSVTATGSGMVIVGAGECGCRAAFALREEGFDGPITLIGEEAHLTYERPPLSKDLLRLDGDLEARHVTDEARLAEAGITHLRRAAATRIERDAKRVALTDGGTVAYSALLLATGAAPRMLPSVGADHRRLATLRTIEDARRIRGHLQPGARLVVVGGGFIGLELAAAAIRSGCSVTVVEAQERILMRAVPAEMASILAERHRLEGVTILTGTSIQSVAETVSDVTFELADGTSISGDIAVVGIGAAPRVELALAAGLAVENGIVVDDELRTRDPFIFAAGDCCAFPLDIYGGARVRLEAWRNAQEQGVHVARSMLGRGSPLATVPWFWSDQYDLTLQVAGLAQFASRTVARRGDDRSLLLFHLDEAGRLVAASGIGVGNAVARDVRLAEMLIAARATPAAESLACPKTKLKTLLAA